MKIVFILPGRGRSGGVKCAVIIGNKLIERGHDVRILCRGAYGIRYKIRQVRDRLLYSLGADGLEGFKGRIDLFRDISECSFSNEEIIIGWGMWASCQLGALNSIPNPKLQYIHGEHIAEPEIARQVFSMPLPKVAVATFLRPAIESGGKGQTIEIIHNGVDLEQYFPSVKETEKEGIGLIYSLHPSKDPETARAVIQSIAEIDKNIPIRAFGTCKRPKQLKRSRYWRYPTVGKARELYSSSVVWIITSRSEGFSLPVLEAMACGCAVVSTDCGGPRDIIRDGENGFLVSVGRSEAIVDKALSLLRNPGLRKQVTSKSWDTVKRFSWDETSEKLEEVLRRLA